MSLDAIGIACKDIEKTIQFYENFDISFKKFGEDHFEGKTKSGLRIMLDSFELMKKINPNWEQPEHPGITLCFLQENPSKVDQVFKKLTEQDFNIVKEPWDAFWGQRYACVKDPDGNQVDIFAAL